MGGVTVARNREVVTVIRRAKLLSRRMRTAEWRRCPRCASTNTHYAKRLKSLACRLCGHTWDIPKSAILAVDPTPGLKHGKATNS